MFRRWKAMDEAECRAVLYDWPREVKVQPAPPRKVSGEDLRKGLEKKLDNREEAA